MGVSTGRTEWERAAGRGRPLLSPGLQSAGDRGLCPAELIMPPGQDR